MLCHVYPGALAGPGLLQVADASFAYGPRGRGPFVLDRVTATVPRGGVVGILGPNGSGKTTLLRLLSGTHAPSSGRVLLEGQPMSAIPRRVLARRVAVVPQETHLAFDYSALEVVLMGRHPHLGVFELEGPGVLTAARAALASTGGTHLETREFNTLSGGEKQRVIIASALAQASEILLLDEPTASLDLGAQLDVITLLSDLNQRRQLTIVISTHDLNVAASLCRELILLRDGRVLTSGRTDMALTPEHVRRLYDVEADVQMHPRAGHITVVPLARVDR